MLRSTLLRRYAAEDLQRAPDPVAYAWERLPAVKAMVLRREGARLGLSQEDLDYVAVFTMGHRLSVDEMILTLAKIRAFGPRYVRQPVVPAPRRPEKLRTRLTDVAVRHGQMPPQLLHGPKGTDAKSLDEHERATERWVLRQARRLRESTFARGVRAELAKERAAWSAQVQGALYAHGTITLRRPLRTAGRARRVARLGGQGRPKPASEPPQGPEDDPPSGCQLNWVQSFPKLGWSGGTFGCDCLTALGWPHRELASIRCSQTRAQGLDGSAP